MTISFGISAFAVLLTAVKALRSDGSKLLQRPLCRSENQAAGETVPGSCEFQSGGVKSSRELNFVRVTGTRMTAEIAQIIRRSLHPRGDATGICNKPFRKVSNHALNRDPADRATTTNGLTIEDGSKRGNALAGVSPL